MVRKFITDSVVYWATEYNIDGFRFDLMGLHHVDTMNGIRAALDEIDPRIIIYGEGWTGGSTPLPAAQAALKGNAGALLNERIAVFSDDIRDGIKGGVFTATQPGYVSGVYGRKEDVKFGIAASVRHPQVNITRVSYSNNFWASAPTQTVTYASAHDNHTLWDKLLLSTPRAAEEEHLAMNRLSAAIVLTSQGIPFIHAGEELARSKNFDENSYRSSDEVNQLRWDHIDMRGELFDYYQGLIALRKERPAFRLRTADEIREHLVFLDTEAQVLAYTLVNHAGGDTAETILVAFNADRNPRSLTLPVNGTWAVYVDGTRAGTEVLYTVSGGSFTMNGRSSYVMIYIGE
jgi:pullulanase